MSTRLLELFGPESIDVLRAIASETRLKMMTLLADGDMNINELAATMGLAQSSVTRHINVLEEAGLVRAELSPGAQGQQKRCHLCYERFLFALEHIPPAPVRIEETEMPLGLYTLSHASAPCGLANHEGLIWRDDNPQAFFRPERGTAQLLWMADGFVEYIFPNTLPLSTDIYRLDFVAEICSETKNYDNDFPSDITLWINGVEAGTWTSPGDLGGKRGRLNPEWWHDHNTQYGLLTQWSVDDSGASVDGVQVSETKLMDLMLIPQQPITIRIGIKPDAINVGGFNLFGRGFGNYEQDLVLRLHYGAPLLSREGDAHHSGMERRMGRINP